MKKVFLKKVFIFLESLKPSFFDVMGFPTVKFYSEFIEVYFDCTCTIRDLDVLDLVGYDEFRFFGGDSCITFVFTFYINNNE